MGYMGSIDENGDAEGNYTLIARTRQGGESAYGMYPIGSFLMPSNSAYVPVRRLLLRNRDISLMPRRSFQDLKLWRNVDWINSRPPLDEPPCGFDGEKCEGKVLATK